MDNNALDLEVAKSVGDFFRLKNDQMDSIINEVLKSVSHWKKRASEIGIARSEQEIMEKAFYI